MKGGIIIKSKMRDDVPVLMPNGCETLVSTEFFKALLKANEGFKRLGAAFADSEVTVPQKKFDSVMWEFCGSKKYRKSMSFKAFKRKVLNANRK